MESGRVQEITKDMYSTVRRSAISTSELGLYSDHSNLYNNNTYSTNIRKLVIGIMVVFSVILIGIFLYDFALSASVNSKVSQETKHIYILQNSFRKPSLNATRRSSVTLAPTIYIVNSSHATGFEDRSDDETNIEYKQEVVNNPIIESRTQRETHEEPEPRMQNLQNFKFRDRMLDRTPDEIEAVDRPKSIIENHAMIYRVSNKMKLPTSANNEAEMSSDDSERATPFRFELTGPPPASFKRSKYPQLSQYQNPHASRNIQDIIKYLTNSPESLNHGIKFTGYYVNPKKYDTDIGEIAMNSEKSEEVVPYTMSFNTDPLYQYKPKHPADVNLLATSNFRFSPMGLQRYNSFYDSYYQRPSSNKYSIYQENQYDNAGSYGTMTYGKKRKPKPFSVMLDIYPITEATEQTKMSSRLKSQTVTEDSDSRRSPVSLIPYHPRYPKAYGIYTQAPPILPIPNQQIPVSEEEEKHQMILHLNLYPKKKSKVTRNDVMERSEAMPSSEKQELIDKLIIPFDEIAKHLTAHAAVEEAKYDEEIDRTDSAKVRYEESPLMKQDVEEIKGSFTVDHSKIQVKADRLIATTNSNKCQNCEMITTEMGSTTSSDSTTVETTTSATIESTTTAATTFIMTETTAIKNTDSTAFKDIDTVEGFQKFADSLIAID